MADLKSVAEAAARQRPEKEILPFEWKGSRYWLKRARKTGSNPLHHAAWKIFRLPLLVPVRSQTPKEALLHESGKLRRLREAGLSVPDVPLVTEEFFVMEDNGPTAHHLLRHELDENPEKFVLKLFESLGELHRLGEYHGGPLVRNLTYYDDSVGFIDLEESFAEDVPLRSLHLRDLFLLLFSLSKDRHPFDLDAAIPRYMRASGNDWAAFELKNFARKLRALEKIASFPPLWKILDKDSKAVHRLLQKLQRLPE